MTRGFVPTWDQPVGYDASGVLVEATLDWLLAEYGAPDATPPIDIEALAAAVAARTLPRRLAVSIPEAARMLGYSENYFRSRVLPDLPIIKATRPRVVVADLEQWADVHKASASSGVGAFGASGSVSRNSVTNTRRGSKPNPRHADRAKRLLERASRSTPQRSKASG